MVKINQFKSNPVIVLLSGGIDSSACVSYYLSQNFSVSALFINYGQCSYDKEEIASSNITEYFRIPLFKVKCSGFKQDRKGFIIARNGFLLYTALMYFPYNSGIIAIGVHAGASYCDCSETFISNLQTSFDFYKDGQIKIEAPFINWNKKEIWEYALKNSLPIEMTYSCELGKTQPCGECLSCKDLEKLYAS